MSFPSAPSLPPSYSTIIGVPSNFTNKPYPVANAQPTPTPVMHKPLDLLPTYSQYATINHNGVLKPKITHSPNSWKKTRSKMTHHNSKPELDTARVKSIMDCSLEGIRQLWKEGYTFKDVENALPSKPNNPYYEETRHAFLERIYHMFTRLDKDTDKSGGRTHHKQMTKRRSRRRTRKGGGNNNNNKNINVKRPKTIRIPVGPQNQVPISIPNISQHIRNVEARLAQVQFAPQNPHSLAAYGSSSNQESQIQKKGTELAKLYKKLNSSTDNLSMLRARLELYRLNNSDTQEANKIQRQINKLLNNK